MTLLECISPLFPVNPSGTRPGAQQSLTITLQAGVRISQKFTRKDKKIFFFMIAALLHKNKTLLECTTLFSVKSTGKRHGEQQSLASALQEGVRA